MISAVLSSSSLIYFSVSSNLLFIPSRVFLNFSYCILQLYWVFFLFSNFMFKFLLCSSTLLPRLLSIFMIVTLSSLSDRLPVSILLSSTFAVLSCSFICNIFLCCLIVPNSLLLFYVLGRMVIFPSPGEGALCSCPVGLSSTLLSGPQSYMLWGTPTWASWAFLLWGQLLWACCLAELTSS